MVEFAKRMEWAEKLASKFTQYTPVVQYDRTNGWVRTNLYYSGIYFGYIEFLKSGKIRSYCKGSKTEQVQEVLEAAKRMIGLNETWLIYPAVVVKKTRMYEKIFLSIENRIYVPSTNSMLGANDVVSVGVRDDGTARVYIEHYPSEIWVCLE